MAYSTISCCLVIFLILCFGWPGYAQKIMEKSTYQSGADVTLTCSPDSIRADKRCYEFPDMAVQRKLHSSPEKIQQFAKFFGAGIKYQELGVRNKEPPTKQTGPLYWKYTFPDIETFKHNKYFYRRDLMVITVVMTSVSPDDSGEYICQINCDSRVRGFPSKLLEFSQTLNISKAVSNQQAAKPIQDSSSHDNNNMNSAGTTHGDGTTTVRNQFSGNGPYPSANAKGAASNAKGAASNAKGAASNASETMFFKEEFANMIIITVALCFALMNNVIHA